MSSEADLCKSIGRPFIRDCTTHDIEELAITMRLEDREEIFHSSGRSPLITLWMGYHASEVRHTIEWRGRVVAIFGVAAVADAGTSMGIPWMLGTDDLRRCWSLLRECRKLLDSYTKKYRLLANAVWSKNEVHIKWIKWIGFQFEGSDVRNGQTFLHFHRSINV